MVTMRVVVRGRGGLSLTDVYSGGKPDGNNGPSAW